MYCSIDIIGFMIV